MKVKCFFIVCAVLFKLVKTDGECSEHFKCFSEFMKEFVRSGLKYDIVIKETNASEEYDSHTSVLTIEIPSKKLISTIKQVIGLFDLYFDAESEIEDKLKNIRTTVGLNTDLENNTALIPRNQTQSKVNKKDFKIKGISNTSDLLKVGDVTMNEVKIDQFDDYYDSVIDNSTDYPIIDYIELYKDTTNDPVDVSVTVVPSTQQLSSTEVFEGYNFTENKEKKQTENITIAKEHDRLGVQQQLQCEFNGTSNDIARSVFPWIATVFVKNDSNGRYDYLCDGALLSDRSVLTAAECITRNGTTIVPDDLIVILGKRSLLTTTTGEKPYRINRTYLHNNFTKALDKGYDLAVLKTDESISFNDGIQPACLQNSTTLNDTKDVFQNSVEIATTGWATSGELTYIRFDKDKSKLCQKDVVWEDTFCANYNNDVTTCPSFGGIFVVKAADNVWRLRGLRTGDQTQKGFCINIGGFYTDLLNHLSWIQSFI